MAETILGIIGAVLGIASMILNHLLTKEKSTSEQAKDRVKQVRNRVERFRYKLERGVHDDAMAEMDHLERNIESLLRLYEKRKADG